MVVSKLVKIIGGSGLFHNNTSTSCDIKSKLCSHCCLPVM